MARETKGYARKLWLLLTGLCALGLRAAPPERPGWILFPPHEDAQFKYYLGRASRASDEATGFAEAAQDAYAQAIRENFGFRTRLETQTYQTLARSDATRRIEESSRSVEIRNFEKVSSFVETGGKGRVNVWILFRYAKAAITAEKIRQSTRPSEDASPPPSEIGVEGRTDTILEVVTEPPGAEVTIDGERSKWLRTPLRLSGVLSPGKHEIVIDHPRYREEREMVILIPNQPTRVKRLLTPAKAKLSVSTRPNDARVFVEGRPVGLSPTDPVPVEAATPVRVEITHPEADRLVREVTVARGEHRELVVDLPVRHQSGEP